MSLEQPKFESRHMAGAEKQKNSEEENIFSLVQDNEFLGKLKQSARITRKLGHESGFSWIMRKDGNIETGKVLEGITDRMPHEEEARIKKTDVSFSKFSESREWGKSSIYGAMHFHPDTNPEEIMPSKQDLEVFVVHPKELEKPDEVDREHILYLNNFWQGTAIVKEDKSIDILLVNGKIGPASLHFLYDEMEETNGFQEKLGLLRKSDFKIHYFENINNLEKIK